MRLTHVAFGFILQGRGNDPSLTATPFPREIEVRISWSTSETVLDSLCHKTLTRIVHKCLVTITSYLGSSLLQIVTYLLSSGMTLISCFRRIDFCEQNYPGNLPQHCQDWGLCSSGVFGRLGCYSQVKRKRGEVYLEEYDKKTYLTNQVYLHDFRRRRGEKGVTVRYIVYLLWWDMMRPNHHQLHPPVTQ